jgi:hypothetical protein
MSKVMPEFEATANSVLDDATAAAPYDAVHHKEGEPHLNETGRVEKTDNGYNVTFGDESGEIGYSMFVEMGHLSRAGNHVPAQPYLFPAFLIHSGELIDSLEGILG